MIQRLATVIYCCLGCSLFPALQAQSPQQGDDVRQRSYLDDDDQRSLADLRFQVDPAEQGNLKITISAVGPNVEPIGGFRGVFGSNRYTAEELELILSGRHVVKVETEFGDGQIVPGRILEGQFGSLPERRLLPDGRIDFLARTLRQYPLELIVDSQTHLSGPRTTRIFVNGRPRLRCSCNIVNGQIEDLEVQSLGTHSFLAERSGSGQPLATGRMILTAAPLDEPPVSVEEWNARDMEGRWVLLTQELENDPTKFTAWVDYLQQKKEFQLLEWMAIYIPDAFKSHGVGEALAKSSAPEWIRVVAWHSNGPYNLGHGEQQANTLLNSQPGLAEHWLHKHKSTIDLWEGVLSQTYENFLADDIAPENSDTYSLPLQPSEVFQRLTSSAPVVDFGDRKKAEPGVLYRHQMVREIQGVTVSGRRDPQLLQQVRDLTKHADAQIRIAAFLAHSYILPLMTLTDPLSEIFAVVDNADEPAIVREAALVGLSYHRHPAVLLKLHQIAGDPTHAAWKGAVSRVGDLGREFSIPLLKQLQSQPLSSEQSAVLADSLTRLTERHASAQTVAAWDMARRIQLAVFASQQNDSNAPQIREWVLKSGKQMLPGDLASLRNEWGLQAIGDFWMPGTKESFEKDYNKLRSDVLESVAQ